MKFIDELLEDQDITSSQHNTRGYNYNTGDHYKYHTNKKGIFIIVH